MNKYIKVRIEKNIVTSDSDENYFDEYLIREELAPIYYDAEGKIDITQRLGCMCCPLASRKKRIIQFQRYPLMAKAYLRAGQKFLDTHPNCKTKEIYESVYEWFTRNVFFPSNEEWNAVSKSIFGKPNFKNFLEKKFGTDLTL